MRATAADKEKIRLCFEATKRRSRSRLAGRRSLSSRHCGSLTQRGAVTDHARFLRRIAVFGETEPPAYVPCAARIFATDGAASGRPDAIVAGDADGARKAMMAHLSFVHTTIKRFDEDQARRARITRLPGDPGENSRRTTHDYFSSQRLSRRSPAHPTPPSCSTI